MFLPRIGKSRTVKRPAPRRLSLQVLDERILPSVTEFTIPTAASAPLQSLDANGEAEFDAVVTGQMRSLVKS
jgi:hypothetical protein